MTRLPTLLMLAAFFMAPSALGMEASLDSQNAASASTLVDSQQAQPVAVSAQAAADAEAEAQIDPRPLPLDDVVKEPQAEPAAAAQSASTDGVEAEPVIVGAVVAVGLAALVWKLVGSGFVVSLFSRIQPNKMLENDQRQRVFALVSENPGVTIKEVTTLLNIGWGTAVYHLKRLEAERLVVSERQRQFRRYYKNGGGIANDTKAAYGELKHPTNQRLVALLLSEPGACQKDLCERAGISAPLASKYLSRLESAGLVATQREWKSVRYYPTPQLEGLWPAVHAPVETRLGAPMAVLA